MTVDNSNPDQDGNHIMYYIHTDYLGSLYAITDENGEIVNHNDAAQVFSFDPWGRRRNHATWEYDPQIDQSMFLFDRGYTGHEHLDLFGLINMNGRMYDPILSRMLSPDNFIQEPDFSQSLNRYSYAWNNPLVNTDPTGDFIVVDSWLFGFVQGFFSTGSGRGSAGWKEAKLRAGNDAKIWGGLFVSDPNKPFGGRVWEIISRITWQSPQTGGGFLTAHSYNTFGLGGGVESVKYKYGATVVKTRGSWGALAQGSYIVGDNRIEADPNNPLFQHEYGHYLQSQSMGLSYYGRVGIPSIWSKGDHNLHPVEQDANRRAFLYLNEHVEGFQDDTELSNENYKDNRGWDFRRNPFASGVGNPTKITIGSRNYEVNYVNYTDNNHINSLSIIKVHAKWYDYTFPIISGFYNAWRYNR